MSSDKVMLELRAEAFQKRRGRTLKSQLGFGHDGTIFITDRQTAVKFMFDAHAWRREVDVYQVLRELNLTQIADHNIPDLIYEDEELLCIEMTVVCPPFLLDFASAKPEEELPDFNEDVWQDWQLQKAEQFGQNWPQAQRVIAEFAHLTGYTLFDIHPGNIRFASDQ